MKGDTILITGAGPNGVTGKRIKEYIEKNYNYDILAPSSKELNLTDFNQVNDYFLSNDIDYIVHSAVLAPSRGHDNSNPADEIESNLRMFLNLTSHSSRFKKLFYIGSGAEFDKCKDIVMVKESNFPRSVPSDKYGFTKFVLQNITAHNSKICNLRVFGTINPYEPVGRNVVTYIVDKVMHGETISLNQNCNFSFVDIDDLARFVHYGINNTLSYNDYNMIGANCEIKVVAEIIKDFIFPQLKITFKKGGYNKEYTGDNSRLLSEKFSPTDLKVSLRKVFDYLGNK